MPYWTAFDNIGMVQPNPAAGHRAAPGPFARCPLKDYRTSLIRRA